MALSTTTAGLPDVGTDIGGFLSALAPGLVDFIFNLSIVGAIIGIIYAIIVVIKKLTSKHGNNA